jgi:cell division protein FtsB
MNKLTFILVCSVFINVLLALYLVKIRWENVQLTENIEALTIQNNKVLELHTKLITELNILNSNAKNENIAKEKLQMIDPDG